MAMLNNHRLPENTNQNTTTDPGRDHVAKLWLDILHGITVEVNKVLHGLPSGND